MATPFFVEVCVARSAVRARCRVLNGAALVPLLLSEPLLASTYSASTPAGRGDGGSGAGGGRGGGGAGGSGGAGGAGGAGGGCGAGPGEGGGGCGGVGEGGPGVGR